MDNTVCCGGRGLSANGCGRSDKQLNSYDYLADVPGAQQMTNLVEVQFKNTHKDYYINSNNIPLKKGDIVAVEASPGHDIGTVSLTGPLVPLQMSKQKLKSDAGTKRIYRIAREVDMEKFEMAKAREQETMIKSRAIAKNLGLDMKIGDVEFQGDGSKAIFYYIADQRVDFRQLIKVLAQEFSIRIDMKQIGARQEAGLIGGFGPCGREMCCATWMKNFSTVSTGAARCQDVSLNPNKLAGQCAKLKCCLNYEVPTYVEAAKKLPRRDIHLETQDATYYYFKADILAGLISYSTDRHLAINIVTISTERAAEIIEMNANGEKPERLESEDTIVTNDGPIDLAEQDSLTRFDKAKKKKKRRSGRNRRPEGGKERTEGAEQRAESKEPRGENKEHRPEQRDNRRENREARGEGNGQRPEGNGPRGEGNHRRGHGNRHRGGDRRRGENKDQQAPQN